jgi:tRNA1(Val) A37 N6-methylase TrmN6
MAEQCAPPNTSEDAVLGGRLVLRQPLRGHRFGHDAILLAAATSARPGARAVDLGAGVGVAGLALARRVPGTFVTLVEIDVALAALAGENAQRNGLGDRVRAICLDVTAPAGVFAAAGLAAGSADCVMMNPPFNALQNPSPIADRRSAHAAPPGLLQQWVRTASRLVRPSGALTLIWRADDVAEVLAALRGFGAVSLLPVYPKPGAAAVRVLARAQRASRGALTILPGLLLADTAGRPTDDAENILRGGRALLPDG